MATYILTWHPHGFPIDVARYIELSRDIANRGELRHGNWSTGNRTTEIEKGDRVFLFRQKRERGIVASGYCRSDVYQADHWDGSDRLANYVRIEWDEWRMPDDRITVETLEDRVPQFKWNSLQGSGIHIEDGDAAKVEKLWGA
jgi:hypothetical protein